MWRFVLVSFVFLGWAFYHLSGGSAYRPAPNSLQARATQDAPVPEGTHGPQTEAVRLASLGVPTLTLTPPDRHHGDRHGVRPPEVTLRMGPGKGYGGMARLERHDEVVVLRAPGGGWVKLRVADTGTVGWMPAGLLYRVP